MPEASPIVRQEIVIDSFPRRVFDAWADPAELARWYVDRAKGDPRTKHRVSWVIDGESEPLEVTTCEPGRRLVLTNVGKPPWAGSVVDVEVLDDGAATRVVVEQRGFAEELREHVPNVDAGWACTLAILQEYLERHAGEARHTLAVRRPVAPEPVAFAAAVSTVLAIAHWAGERPERLLATTDRGAVMAFADDPGVYSVMGTRTAVSACEFTGAVMVWYTCWGAADAEAARPRAERLASQLAACTQTD